MPILLPSLGLPIEPVLPALCAALRAGNRAVLQAPPGAGKTTLVPLALLDESWLAGRKIVVLEPRRLAARAAARRMAALCNEAVGETIGYRVRLDSQVGPRTRVEMVTEGVFIRLLQDDPGLDGIGAVLFDEFHERNLDADLALALCIDAQKSLREDLRVLVMSATLDGAAVAKLLDDAPVIASEGRAFPVETFYVDMPSTKRIEDGMASAIRAALDQGPGDVLAFLPGAGEIRRTEQRLDGLLEPTVDVWPLFGDLAAAQQDAAIKPAPAGRRKVVLATSIAETSLTIEGVTAVVDSGLMRVPRFDPASGMTRLDTIRVSRAAADQRRGRAGRLGPGRCYRLWSGAAQRALLPFTAPEMLAADLAPLALSLAEWGMTDPASLAWLDPPPAAPFAQARDLLIRLAALDAKGQITRHGRALASLGTHPRLAHMLIHARDSGQGALAVDIAALLGERDLLRSAQRGPRDADLRLRLELLRGRADLPADTSVDRGAQAQVKKVADQWRRQLRLKPEAVRIDATGAVLALAYPDRIAQPRGAPGRFRLSNGRGAILPPTDPLAASEYLSVAALDGDAQEARIFLAAPLTLAELEEQFSDAITSADFVQWDSREEAVQARRQRRFGALVLKDEPLTRPDATLVQTAVMQGIRELGLAALPWTDELRNWQARVDFLRTLDGDAWPDTGDAALLNSLESWLAPFLGRVTRRSQFGGIDLAAALHALLDWKQGQALDRLAPTHLTVPSGSHIPVDYRHGEVPVLAVRLQEMFGLAVTPSVADGRVPLLLHLLSPAHRPVQITRDLPGFWASSYRAVKSDLKGRYPKHPWPDDPLAAPPTRRAKPRGT